MKTETYDICVTGLKRLINKYIWRMDPNMPEISVRPEALVFRYNSRKEYTTIPWSEITDIKLIKDDFGHAVMPVLKDPQKYIDACSNKFIKMGMKKSLKDDGSPFAIRVDNLSYGADDIAGMIQDYWKENGQEA